jgi:hypothetical protein
MLSSALKGVTMGAYIPLRCMRGIYRFFTFKFTYCFYNRKSVFRIINVRGNGTQYFRVTDFT